MRIRFCTDNTIIKHMGDDESNKQREQITKDITIRSFVTLSEKQLLLLYFETNLHFKQKNRKNKNEWKARYLALK